MEQYQVVEVPITQKQDAPQEESDTQKEISFQRLYEEAWAALDAKSQ